MDIKELGKKDRIMFADGLVCNGYWLVKRDRVKFKDSGHKKLAEAGTSFIHNPGKGTVEGEDPMHDAMRALWRQQNSDNGEEAGAVLSDLNTAVPLSAYEKYADLLITEDERLVGIEAHWGSLWRGFELYQGAEGEPIRIRDQHEKLVGVIMPVRLWHKQLKDKTDALPFINREREVGPFREALVNQAGRLYDVAAGVSEYVASHGGEDGVDPELGKVAELAKATLKQIRLDAGREG